MVYSCVLVFSRHISVGENDRGRRHLTYRYPSPDCPMTVEDSHDVRDCSSTNNLPIADELIIHDLIPRKPSQTGIRVTSPCIL